MAGQTTDNFRVPPRVQHLTTPVSRIQDRSRLASVSGQRLRPIHQRPYAVDSFARTMSNQVSSPKPTPQVRPAPARSLPLAARPMPNPPQAVPPQPQTTLPTMPVRSRRRLPALPRLALRNQSKPQLLLTAMACLVFMVGLVVSLQTVQTNHGVKAQVAALAAKSTSSNNDNSGAVPSEAKPKGSGAAYAVAPNAPKYFKIAKLGVSARVVSLGVTSQNELKAPTNIYDTGWYDASARPGDSGSNGAMLIDGHVHGPTLPGVFVNIKKLAPGDVIQVVRGDNQVFNYSVVRVQNYDAGTMNMGMMLTSVQPGVAGLNLITCGGPYDKASGEYTQRTAVFAVQRS